METKTRDSYFDFLRGVAIAMVVAIHTYVATDEINVIVLLRQSLNCAVPLFLAISGYFIGKKNLLSLSEYTSFLKKQIPRVYVPMLLWSMPWLILDLKSNGLCWNMLSCFLGGYSVYYFIFLIIQLYLLTPVIQMVSLRKNLIVSSLITILGISLFCFLMHVRQFHIPLYINGSPFFLWLIFYVLGVKLSNGIRFRGCFVALGVFFLILSLWETYVYSTMGQVAHGIKISSHVYSVFIILIALSNELRANVLKYQKNFIVRALSFLGRQSFFIYLFHMFVKFFVDKTELFFFDGGWLVRWIVVLFASALVSFTIKLMAGKKINYYLGN
jgi:surface polysaccharide O-acyltransferase-like enzyme